jgi:hypothetical protein
MPGSNWKDDPDVTQTNDGDDAAPDRMSLLGDMRTGDEVALTFHDDGEVEERDHGKQVAFEVTVEELGERVRPYTWDDDEVFEGDRLILETGSTPLLSKLANVDLAGRTVTIIREGMDYQTDYSVIPDDGDAAAASGD